jgi:hypothetical protein
LKQVLKVMRIERRLKALERKMKSEPVLLVFEDGSRQEIHGPKHFLLDLLIATGQPSELTPVQTEQWELIRKSVRAREPGNGRLTELIRCFAGISRDWTLDDPEGDDLAGTE